MNLHPQPLIITIAKLFLLLMVFTSAASSAETNKLGWSTEQAQTWARMKAENHPLYQRLKTSADGVVYADNGIYDGLYYLVTGEVRYAQSAYDTVSHYDGVDTGGSSPNRNSTRHLFGSMAMLYS